MWQVINIHACGEPHVYAGRGRNGCHMLNTKAGTRGWLGNPFKLEDFPSRKACIKAFAREFFYKIETDGLFAVALGLLQDRKDKNLGCWCWPAACHADVIAAWLNKMERS